MNRLRFALALALPLASVAAAQSSLPVRVEGSLTRIDGTPSGGLAGVSVGEAVTLDLRVLVPGTPQGNGVGLYYEIDPSSVLLRIGTRSEAGDPAATPIAQIAAEPDAVVFAVNAVLPGDRSLFVVLLDQPPTATFPTDDLAALIGTYGASLFDGTVLFEIFGSSGPSFERLSIEIDQLVIGSGAGLGTSYCGPATPNSSGGSAAIFALGTNAVIDNDLTLRAISLPTNSFSFFLASQTQGSIANPGGSEGTLCLGGAIGRFVGAGQIQNSGANGEVGLTVDLTQIPQPTGSVSVAVGQTWNFQGWFRDSVGGTATSNFTDGLSVTFE
ncbi:MAG: hypothetical protein AAF957_21550 [Planctomycetota bacterium]